MIARLAGSSKSITTLVVGGLAWGNFVVASAPGGVTSREWMKLAAVLGAAALTWLVPNVPQKPAPPRPPAPQPVEAWAQPQWAEQHDA